MIPAAPLTASPPIDIDALLKDCRTRLRLVIEADRKMTYCCQPLIDRIDAALTASRSLNQQHVADLRRACARIRFLGGDMGLVEEIEKGLNKE